MTLFLEHLWCDVVGGAKESWLALAIVIHFCSQSKITQFDLIENKVLLLCSVDTSLFCNNAYLHIIIEKNVAQLEISVNDFVIVQVFHSHKHLFEVVSVKSIIFGLETCIELPVVGE